MIVLMEFALIQMNVNVFMVIKEKDVMLLTDILFMCIEFKKREINVNVKMVFMENYVRLKYVMIVVIFVMMKEIVMKN